MKIVIMVEMDAFSTIALSLLALYLASKRRQRVSYVLNSRNIQKKHFFSLCRFFFSAIFRVGLPQLLYLKNNICRFKTYASPSRRQLIYEIMWKKDNGEEQLCLHKNEHTAYTTADRTPIFQYCKELMQNVILLTSLFTL